MWLNHTGRKEGGGAWTKVTDWFRNPYAACLLRGAIECINKFTLTLVVRIASKAVAENGIST